MELQPTAANYPVPEEVVLEFERESNLKLKNPENLEEMAFKTEVEMYLIVTNRESD